MYKPTEIKILLIGEAPPPGGKTYFYKTPEKYTPTNKIESDTSLPGTIFNHFFKRRPLNTEEYGKFLDKLKRHGIFLIDIYEAPIKIRGNLEESLPIVFSEQNIDDLKQRVNKLISPDTTIVFLLARSYPKRYLSRLKAVLGNAEFVRWIEFRMNPGRLLSIDAPLYFCSKSKLTGLV